MRLGASRGELARGKENRVSPKRLGRLRGCVRGGATQCEMMRLSAQIAEEGLEPPARGLWFRLFEFCERSPWQSWIRSVLRRVGHIVLFHLAFPRTERSWTIRREMGPTGIF